MLRLPLTALVAAALLPAVAHAQAFPQTGTAGGVTPMKANNTKGFPPPDRTPGQPVERRAPELDTDKPAFPGQTRAPYRPTVQPRVTVLTDQLRSPWSLAFLPDGRMLVTEKPGTLRLVDSHGHVSAPVRGVPAVSYQGQVGLLDVALAKDFAQSHRLYLSFAEAAAGDKTNIAIASARLDPTALSLSDVKVIFRARPALPKALAQNAGGRLAVAADGTLFATIGDRSKSPPWDVAQRLDTHLGKIIHITADGAPAPGNPFVGQAGALPEIWSLGHRSEIALTFDRRGQLWENENGPRGGDEINLIQPGRNYGWPVIVHGIDYPGEKIDGGLTQKPGLEQPVYYWDPVIAPSGMAFYDADLFPQWKGSVLVGALRGEMLDRLTLRGDRVIDEEPLLSDLHARIRDVRVGPDGAVYVLTDDTRLLKLTPN